MKITEHRTKEIVHWLDDKAADHTLLFEEMTLHRDAAALIRQLQAAEQDAWRAGLDAGREQRNAALRQAHKDYGCELADPNGTIWDHAANLQREVEALRTEVAAQCVRADAMAGEGIKHEARAERLEEALRSGAQMLRELANSEYNLRFEDNTAFGRLNRLLQLSDRIEAQLRDQEAGE